MTFFASILLLALGGIVAVMAGAAGGADDVPEGSAVIALLVAIMLFVLQAILWTRFGIGLMEMPR